MSVGESVPEKLADPRTDQLSLFFTPLLLIPLHSSLSPLIHSYPPSFLHTTTMAALQHVKRVWTNFLSQGGYDAHALSGVSYHSSPLSSPYSFHNDPH